MTGFGSRSHLLLLELNPFCRTTLISPLEIPEASMSLSENTIRYSQLGTSHAWRPGALRQFPVLGVIQLVGVVLGICAAITILIVSDQALISDWKYSPAVYLTISYTISNFLLAAAFAQGVTVGRVVPLLLCMLS